MTKTEQQTETLPNLLVEPQEEEKSLWELTREKACELWPDKSIPSDKEKKLKQYSQFVEQFTKGELTRQKFDEKDDEFYDKNLNDFLDPRFAQSIIVIRATNLDLGHI